MKLTRPGAKSRIPLAAINNEEIGQILLSEGNLLLSNLWFTLMKRGDLFYMEVLFLKVRYQGRRLEAPLLGEMRAIAIRFEVEHIFAPINPDHDQIFYESKF